MLGLHKEAIIAKKEQKWEKEKSLILREQALKEDQKITKPHFKISTSKLLIAFLFINCTLIELFTGFITLKTFDVAEFTAMMPDFTPLVTLIGAVVSEVIGFAVYALKSTKENTKGGIIYDLAMQEADNDVTINDEDEEIQG